jgi:hypothetical protein
MSKKDRLKDPLCPKSTDLKGHSFKKDYCAGKEQAQGAILSKKDRLKEPLFSEQTD